MAYGRQAARDDERVQIILGAGLSGLSLAVALVRAGVREPIVIVDRRTTFEHDRTWCTWDAPDTPFLGLATHRWAAWEVRAGGQTGRGGSAARPYVHLPSDVFYAAALEELRRAANVELRLGERVLEIGDGWARTDRGRLEGLVHDGLALSGPALRDRPAGAVELWQSFLGWEVELAQPRFDPACATLMDFDIEAGDGVEFMYVLPFSPTRALVEHTSFAVRSRPPAERRAAILAYLDGVDHAVLREERGRLLMTTASLTALRSPRTTAIGTAGGALRASSGYAFSRVQAHVGALARAIADGRPLPERAGDRRRAALDAVFLRALASDPGAFPERFRALVARVPGDVFARFMTDRSSLRDEALVMAALPPAPFAVAGVRSILRA